MGVKNKEKPLRDDDYIRVLLTSVRNGIVMKVDDPCNEVPSTTVYVLDNLEIDDDINQTDPEKVRDFLYDLLDALCVNVSERAKKRLSIEVKRRLIQ